MQNNELISIDELYEEILEIYDFDLNAIYTHMSYLIDRHKKTSIQFKRLFNQISKLNDELSEQKNLEKYRLVFNDILESFNEDIEKYRKISKLDIKGISSIFHMILLIVNEKQCLDELSESKKTELKKELVEIIFYSQEIISALEINNEK